jgi:hypothetical protein
MDSDEQIVTEQKLLTIKADVAHSTAAVEYLQGDFPRVLVVSRELNNRKDSFIDLALKHGRKGNPGSQHQHVDSKASILKQAFDVENEVPKQIALSESGSRALEESAVFTCQHHPGQ